MKAFGLSPISLLWLGPRKTARKGRALSPRSARRFGRGDRNQFRVPGFGFRVESRIQNSLPMLRLRSAQVFDFELSASSLALWERPVLSPSGCAQNKLPKELR